MRGWRDLDAARRKDLCPLDSNLGGAAVGAGRRGDEGQKTHGDGQQSNDERSRRDLHTANGASFKRRQVKAWCFSQCLTLHPFLHAYISNKVH
jgi:hypothetical protein